MTLGQRIDEIRTGFERPFWIANVTEIFERLSYYAVFAVLALYLNKALGFPVAQASSLTGLFGGAVWVMAIFGGALADRIGFRRALSSAYLILTVAYFLIGSVGAGWMAPVLFLPALGVALVKPSVVGTTARASKESVRSLGYAIYYTMVNVGSFCGPFLAGLLLVPETIFRVAALSVLVMFFVVLLFFKEPRPEERAAAPTLRQVARNLVTVLGNWKFLIFLLIFSGYWVVFWQQYEILPIYIQDYVDAHANTAMILITDPLIVITLTVAVSALTRRIPAVTAITLGTLVTSVGWLVLAALHSVLGAVLSLALVALGEITLSPRYYEYISRLAPSGQEGTYLGFAFLPIGIGSLIGGPLGGMLLAHFGEALHRPVFIFPIVTAVGLVTALLLWAYDVGLRRR